MDFRRKLQSSAATMLGQMPYIERVKQFISRKEDCFSVIGYHRIKDDYSVGRRFDDGLINASCDEFEWQVRYLKNNFDPITFNDLKDIVYNGVSLPRRAVIITFDDGFDDNYTNAFRILSSHSVPATFFVTSGLIGVKEPFWFEKMHYILSDLSIDRVPDIDGSVLDLRCDRSKAINSLVGRLKKVPDTIRQDYMNDLELKTNVLLVGSDLAESKTMGWDQVIEMSRSGMEIGSHTESHAILSSLKDDQLNHELCASKHKIESMIEKEVDVIAYPNGDDASIGPVVEEATKEAGYVFGVKYGVSGSNELSSFNRYGISRLGILASHQRGLFRVAMNYPGLVF